MSSKIDRAIQGQLLLPKGFGSPLTLKALKDDERSVSGLDIEADSITAEPIMLGYSRDNDNGYILLNKPEDVIDFHTRFSFRSSINFYYNLQYDFEGMLKLFPPDIAMLLYGSSSAYLNDKCEAVTSEDIEQDMKKVSHRLSYIPKKAFHIKKIGDKKYSYYDLLQYYQMSLATAAKKYLDSSNNKDKEKGDFKAAYTSKKLFNGLSTISDEIQRFHTHIINNPLIAEGEKNRRIQEMTDFFNSFSSSNEYREKMILYCIQDANVCRELGHIIVDGVNSFRQYEKLQFFSKYLGVLLQE